LASLPFAETNARFTCAACPVLADSASTMALKSKGVNFMMPHSVISLNRIAVGMSLLEAIARIPASCRFPRGLDQLRTR
jgi:hypothetical protein